MKIAQVTGFLGSGKTTFLILLAKELGSRGYRVANIVNDVGHINVDRQLMESKGLLAKEVSGGCICCEVSGTFTTTIVNLWTSYQPDIILVEPSGVALPWGLKRTLEESMNQNVVRIEHTPIITFVDALRFDKLIDRMDRLVEAQILGADIVLLNKTDAIDADVTLDILVRIRAVNPDADVITGSGLTGAGVSHVADLIMERSRSRVERHGDMERFEKDYA